MFCLAFKGQCYFVLVLNPVRASLHVGSTGVQVRLPVSAPFASQVSKQRRQMLQDSASIMVRYLVCASNLGSRIASYLADSAISDPVAILDRRLMNKGVRAFLDSLPATFRVTTPGA